MRQSLIPFLGIVLVTMILVALNEWTDWAVVRDYAFVFIVAAMLFGLWLEKRISQERNESST